VPRIKNASEPQGHGEDGSTERKEDNLAAAENFPRLREKKVEAKITLKGVTREGGERPVSEGYTDLENGSEESHLQSIGELRSVAGNPPADSLSRR